MTVVMMAMNANTDANATEIYADTDASVGNANAEQRNCKDGSNKSFHGIASVERHCHSTRGIAGWASAVSRC
jgi:hypothetical protein